MTRSIPKLARVLALVATLSLVATACGDGGGGDGDAEPGGGGTEGQAAQQGGEFSFYLGEPEFLAPPQNVTESEGAKIVRALWSPLVRFNPDTIEPIWGEEAPDAVAADIVGNEDSTVWTITLKDGWTFHNGEPVTAESFVNAWNWGAYGPNAANANYFFADIEGYEALNPADPDGDGPQEAPAPDGNTLTGLRVIDELNFEVTLADPFSQYPMKLGYTAFNAMPEAAFSDVAALQVDEQFNEQPIGNGPYQMAGPWQHDEQIQLERYEDYAGTPGNADRMTGRIYADVNTGYTDLIAGNLDVMDDIPPERIEEARSQYQDRIITHTSSYFGFIGMPVYQEPYDNPNVRKALSMAFDRQQVIDTILKNGEPAGSYLAPVINGYRENPCGETCTYNPEQAKQLWDEALPNGLDGPLVIWFNSGAGHEPVYEAVANQWRQNLGVEEVQFQTLDFAEYLPKLENHEITGPYRLAWVMDYPSPQNYLGNLLACEGSANYTGYCNEEADQLVLEANATQDNQQAIELYQQAEDLMLQDLPIIPFYYRNDEGIHSERVSNVNYDVFSTIEYPRVVVES